MGSIYTMDEKNKIIKLETEYKPREEKGQGNHRNREANAGVTVPLA